MKAGRIAAVVGTVLLLAFGVDLVSARRQLLAGRRMVDEAFAQVDLALGQRAGAVARLAAAIAGNAGLERTPFDVLLASRASAIEARTRPQKIAADERVERALAHLPLFEEIHPDVRSWQNFGNLERDLVDAEGGVAIARGTYNDAVLRYNASLVSFPRNIAARMFGFHQENDYFKPDGGSESSR
jgi:LemA protein